MRILALLPKDWIAANVIPVFKRNKRNLACNYQPISPTSLVVKTMERIILGSLTDVLTSNGLLNPHQYGFCRAHSTSHLLIEAESVQRRAARWIKSKYDTI